MIEQIKKSVIYTLRSRYVRVSAAWGQNNLDFWSVLHESIPKSNQWVVPRERSGTFCKSVTSVIEMYLREIIIFGVQKNDYFRQHRKRKPYANTLLMPKKSAWNGKFVSKGTLKYKAKLTFELKCSSVRGGLDPIAIQSNHPPGNPLYTLTKRLLGNLTDLWFSFGFFLAFKVSW